MRQAAFLGVGAILLIALTGCGGGPAPTTPGTGPTAPPGSGTPAPTSSPQVTVPPAVGTECAGIPTFSLESPQPSFPQDAQLNARFPTTIDGQPVTDVGSQSLLFYLCYIGGQAGMDRVRNEMPAGFNWANITIGYASATVDGESVSLGAFRMPGQDANTIVDQVRLLAASSGDTGTMSQSSLGGKMVYVWTNSDNSIAGYAWASGDVLFTVDNITPEQATKIFAAFQ